MNLAPETLNPLKWFSSDVLVKKPSKLAEVAAAANRKFSLDSRPADGQLNIDKK